MGHLYTTPALRLHTKAHTGYTTRQCIYSPRYIQYALRHVVFCYSFAWMSIRTLSFNADIFFFFPFRYSYFFLLLEKILFFSSIIVISFVLFFRRNERNVRRSKLLNGQSDTFSSVQFCPFDSREEWLSKRKSLAITWILCCSVGERHFWGKSG